MRLPGLALAAVLLSGCAADAVYDIEIKDREAIERVATSWIDAYRRGDIEALMSLYTQDATVMLHGQPALRGKRAIRQYFEPTMGKSDVEFLLDPEQFELHGDAAHYVARYWLTATPRDGGEVYRDAGRSMLIYRRENGVWKIHADIDQATPDAVFPPPAQLRGPQ